MFHVVIYVTVIVMAEILPDVPLIHPSLVTEQLQTIISHEILRI